MSRLASFFKETKSGSRNIPCQFHFEKKSLRKKARAVQLRESQMQYCILELGKKPSIAVQHRRLSIFVASFSPFQFHSHAQSCVSHSDHREGQRFLHMVKVNSMVCRKGLPSLLACITKGGKERRAPFLHSILLSCSYDDTWYTPRALPQTRKNRQASHVTY